MDLTADPRKDFRRYAAGRWIDAAVIPADDLRVSGIQVLVKRVEVQIGTLLDEAERAGATAARGSPAQQVGDFYRSGMDEKRLTELGVTPLQPDFDRIAAIDGRKSLADTLARLAVATNDTIVLGAAVGTDTVDRKRYTIYVGDGDLPLGVDNYLKPEMQKIRDGYVRQVAAYLVIAGSTPEDAKAAAERILAIETRIAGKKLTPVEKRDLAKRYQKMRYDDLRSMLGNVDDAYFADFGLPTGGEVIVLEGAALRERNAMLAELPLSDTKSYLRWELLRRAAPYLTPAFLSPGKAFAEVLYGHIELPPRDRAVAQQVAGKLGHPLGSCTWRSTCRPRPRRRPRIWCCASRPSSAVGWRRMPGVAQHPARGAGEVRHDEGRRGRSGAMDRPHGRRHPARRLLRQCGADQRVQVASRPRQVGQASAGRRLCRAERDAADRHQRRLPGQPEQHRDPGGIPAGAVLRSQGRPGAYFCALGAVIGHEFTHGFDSLGRLYDAKGSVRDWWTAADARHFEKETQKLVRQASAVEVVPGLHINGELSVGENLADVGGIALGAAALDRYLRDHPQENRKIDGLTQTQRCYLSWAQAWADRSNEGWLRQILPVDGHPPGVYRMIAPAQHERAFYQAFGIRAGDPAWLDPKRRVSIW